MRKAWLLAPLIAMACSGTPPPVQVPAYPSADDLYVDQVCVDYQYIRRPDLYCQKGFPGYHWSYESYHSWDRPLIVVVGQPVDRHVYVDNRPNVTVNHYYTGDSVPPPQPKPTTAPTTVKTTAKPTPTRNPAIQRGGLGVRTTTRARPR